MVSIAAIKEIPELVSLINSAYRGEISKTGWTSEADYISGELRTDAEDLLEQMQRPGAEILKYTNDENKITGCVFVEVKEDMLYFGMLSVVPSVQNKGVGKHLLTGVENYAKEKACSSIYMQVISLRKELIEWYEKRGYQKTDQTKPFPSDTPFGAPKQPLEFLVMKKGLK